MTISYKRLWKTLIDHEWNKTKLRKETKMSASTMAKLGKNEYVSLEVIARICEKLQCQPEDVFEIITDSQASKSYTDKQNQR